MAYDAFISYSHAADGRLAPAVQSGLQRLGRRWYRPRALSVFRDETGLTVNPHLWGSIQRALDDSRWFVVLCAPESAASPWVQRELDHWLATKDPQRILPVVTGGAVAWDNARRDFTADSDVPASLRGVFEEEPRFLDLRWAHDETDLDLRNSHFRESIAALAAPMHNVTKEELESEDIRQYRRGRRYARLAVAALFLLAIVAALTGTVAVANAQDAVHAKHRAQREATRARAAQRSAVAAATRALKANHRATTAEAAQRLKTQEAVAAGKREAAARRKAEAATAQATQSEQDAQASAQQAQNEADRADQEATNAKNEKTRADEQAAIATANEKTARNEAARANTAEGKAKTEATKAQRSAKAEHQAKLLAQSNAHKAAANAKIALDRAIAANGLAQAQSRGGLDTGLLLSAEAARRSNDRNVRDDVFRALQARPAQLARFLPGSATYVKRSPDGRWIATVDDFGNGDAVVRSIDRKVTLTLPHAVPSSATTPVAFSADGSRIALTGTPEVFDTNSGRSLYRGGEASDLVALDEHGQHLASLGGGGHTISVVDLGNPAVAHDIAVTSMPSETVNQFALAPDGSQLAVVVCAVAGPPIGGMTNDCVFELRVYEVATGMRLASAPGVHSGATWVEPEYRPVDGQLRIVTLGVGEPQTEAAVVWETQTLARVGAPILAPALRRGAAGESIVDVNADLTRLLTTDGSGPARVYNAQTGAKVVEFPAGFDSITAFALQHLASFGDPAGSTVVSGGEDITVFTVDASRRSLESDVRLGSGLSPVPGSTALADGGSRFAYVDPTVPDAVRVVDARTGALVEVAHVGGPIAPGSLSIDRGGTRFAVITEAFAGGRLVTWNIGDNASLLGRDIDGTGTTALSLDGRTVAVSFNGGGFPPPFGRDLAPDASVAGTELRDAGTGQLTYRTPDSFVVFAPGDRAIFFNSALEPYAVRASTGEAAGLPFAGTAYAETPFVYTASAFAAGGRYAVVHDPNDQTRFVVIDILRHRRTHIVVTRANAPAIGAVVSPDGRTLAVNTQNSTTQLYDVASGLPIGAEFVGGDLRGFTADGRELLVLSSSDTGDVTLARLGLTRDAVRREVCATVGRDLSSTEWSRYIGGVESEASRACG